MQLKRWTCNKSLRIPTLRKYWQVAAVNLISAWLGDNPAFSMYIVTASKAAGWNLVMPSVEFLQPKFWKLSWKNTITHLHTSTTSIPTSGAFLFPEGLGPRRLIFSHEPYWIHQICQLPWMPWFFPGSQKALLFRSLPKSSPWAVRLM